MAENENSSASFSVLWWIGGIVLFIFGLIAAFYFYTFDTQYAPGFSGGKFSAIKLGDTEQSVIASLGQPFSIQTGKPYSEWIYSADHQTDFSRSGEGSGTHTTIRFDTNGQVIAIRGMLQTSASTFSFGEGCNYLGLTSGQIATLTGKSRSEITNQFGPPKAIYEDKSVRLLRYSQSPSSANYHLRAIGIDANGRVIKIWRQVYWD